MADRIIQYKNQRIVVPDYADDDYIRERIKAITGEEAEPEGGPAVPPPELTRLAEGFAPPPVAPRDTLPGKIANFTAEALPFVGGAGTPDSDRNQAIARNAPWLAPLAMSIATRGRSGVVPNTLMAASAAGGSAMGDVSAGLPVSGENMAKGALFSQIPSLLSRALTIRGLPGMGGGGRATPRPTARPSAAPPPAAGPGRVPPAAGPLPPPLARPTTGPLPVPPAAGPLPPPLARPTTGPLPMPPPAAPLPVGPPPGRLDALRAAGARAQAVPAAPAGPPPGRLDALRAAGARAQAPPPLEMPAIAPPASPPPGRVEMMRAAQDASRGRRGLPPNPPPFVSPTTPPPEMFPGAQPGPPVPPPPPFGRTPPPPEMFPGATTRPFVPPATPPPAMFPGAQLREPNPFGPTGRVRMPPDAFPGAPPPFVPPATPPPSMFPGAQPPPAWSPTTLRPPVPAAWPGATPPGPEPFSIGLRPGILDSLKKGANAAQSFGGRALGMPNLPQNSAILYLLWRMLQQGGQPPPALPPNAGGTIGP